MMPCIVSGDQLLEKYELHKVSEPGFKAVFMLKYNSGYRSELNFPAECCFFSRMM